MNNELKHARSSFQWRGALDVIATLGVIATCGAVLFSQFRPQPVAPPKVLKGSKPPEAPLPDNPVSLAGAQIMGSEDAKVALIVYSDFQCPFCARFADQVLPGFAERFVKTGQAEVAFRQFPLSIHPFAAKAAQASACAGAQGQFWPMHDSLFADQQNLDTPALIRRATKLNINARQFMQCLGAETAPEIAADKASAAELKISGTPTIFLGLIQTDRRVKLTRRFAGVPAPQDLEGATESLLKGNASQD